MTATAKLYAVLAALALMVGAFFAFRSHERSVGALQYVVKDDVTVIHQQDSVLAHVAPRLEVDTVRLTTLVNHRDSLVALSGALATAQAALAGLAAQGPVHDTITVRVPAALVVADDSTIRSCKATVNDCEIYGRAEKLRADALAAELAATIKKTPGFFSRCGLSIGYGAVEVANAIKVGPSVIAGCRVAP